MNASHYSLAQVGSRAVTGYRRTATVPASIGCEYPESFTHLDLGRALDFNAGRFHGTVTRKLKTRLELVDAMGRVTSFRKTGKTWKWSEESAKGLLTGKVANLPRFEASFKRAEVSPHWL